MEALIELLKDYPQWEIRFSISLGERYLRLSLVTPEGRKAERLISFEEIETANFDVLKVNLELAEEALVRAEPRYRKRT